MSQKRRRNSGSCRLFDSCTRRASVGRPASSRAAVTLVFPDAADLVARGLRRRAHTEKRLFGRLVAQEPEGCERDRDDREQDDARDREEQQAFQRARPREKAAQSGLRLLDEPQRDGFQIPKQRVQAQCPPVPERHSTRVLATSVRIASIARSDATAKAATKLYSL